MWNPEIGARNDVVYLTGPPESRSYVEQVYNFEAREPDSWYVEDDDQARIFPLVAAAPETASHFYANGYLEPSPEQIGSVSSKMLLLSFEKK